MQEMTSKRPTNTQTKSHINTFMLMINRQYLLEVHPLLDYTEINHGLLKEGNIG
jgi:hypothetical protein